MANRDDEGGGVGKTTTPSGWSWITSETPPETQAPEPQQIPNNWSWMQPRVEPPAPTVPSSPIVAPAAPQVGQRVVNPVTQQQPGWNMTPRLSTLDEILKRQVNGGGIGYNPIAPQNAWGMTNNAANGQMNTWGPIAPGVAQQQSTAWWTAPNPQFSYGKPATYPPPVDYSASWQPSPVYAGARVPRGMNRWEEPEATQYNSYVPGHLPPPPKAGGAGGGGTLPAKLPGGGGGGGGGGYGYGGDSSARWWLAPSVWRI